MLLAYGFHAGEFVRSMLLLAAVVGVLAVLRRWLGPDGVEMALGLLAVAVFLAVLLG